jgi:hypothetical protein
MNFLPIVERELRVRARRGVTHWARFALAAALALISLSYFGSGALPPAAIARSVFIWLIAASFLLACAACALTADTLSGEHREGSLGLLFLTGLRSWDVTLGKLASSALSALYAALGLIPILMLPLLAGGVSGGEATRSGLAIVATILLALTAGLAASAQGSSRGSSLLRCSLWVGAWVLVPPFLELFVSGFHIGLLSPVIALKSAQDSEYLTAPALFWVSLAVQLIHAALLLVRADVRLRRQVREPVVLIPQPAAPSPDEVIYSADSFSDASYRAINPAQIVKSEREYFEGGPLEWLIRKQPGQGALCWGAALTLLVNHAGIGLMSFARVSPLLHSALTLSWIGFGLLAWAACRFLFVARQSGGLELLLTTPLGAETLVSAHWRAMRRMLFGPAVLALAPCVLGIIFSLVSLTSAAPGSNHLFGALYGVVTALDLVLRAVAVNWLGMLFALTARRLVGAIGLTLALTVGLPVLVSSALQLVVQPFFVGATSMRWMIALLIHYPITWALLIWLVVQARKRLRETGPAELNFVSWAGAVMDFLRPSLREQGRQSFAPRV